MNFNFKNFLQYLYGLACLHITSLVKVECPLNQFKESYDCFKLSDISFLPIFVPKMGLDSGKVVFMTFLYSKLQSTSKWKEHIGKNIADQKYNVQQNIYHKAKLGEQKIQYP